MSDLGCCVRVELDDEAAVLVQDAVGNSWELCGTDEVKRVNGREGSAGSSFDGAGDGEAESLVLVNGGGNDDLDRSEPA